MSVEAFFQAAREHKREMTGSGLSQADVDALSDILDTWKPNDRLGPAIDLIKRFEGYAKALPNGDCMAYPDPASGGDPWTIGFGTTGPDVKRGTVWTRAQAEARLCEDVNQFAKGVDLLVASTATASHEFQALVSLSYNIGLANLASSTLLKKHRAGDKKGAAAEFAKWVYAAGKKMPGLVKRRAAEAALYRGDVA